MLQLRCIPSASCVCMFVCLTSALEMTVQLATDVLHLRRRRPDAAMETESQRISISRPAPPRREVSCSAHACSSTTRCVPSCFPVPHLFILTCVMAGRCAATVCPTPLLLAAVVVPAAVRGIHDCCGVVALIVRTDGGCVVGSARLGSACTALHCDALRCTALRRGRRNSKQIQSGDKWPLGDCQAAGAGGEARRRQNERKR